MSWLFGKKKKLSVSDQAKQYAELCEIALEIVRKCDSIGGKEIKELAETLKHMSLRDFRLASLESQKTRNHPSK